MILEEASQTTGTSGYAPESVPLAIFIAARFRDSRSAILASIKCGGDTHTIASMAGQLCGAIGSEIPEAWEKKIPGVEDIHELSNRLVRAMR